MICFIKSEYISFLMLFFIVEQFFIYYIFCIKGMKSMTRILWQELGMKWDESCEGEGTGPHCLCQEDSIPWSLLLLCVWAVLRPASLISKMQKYLLGFSSENKLIYYYVTEIWFILHTTEQRRSDQFELDCMESGCYCKMFVIKRDKCTTWAMNLVPQVPNCN